MTFVRLYSNIDRAPHQRSQRSHQVLIQLRDLQKMENPHAERQAVLLERIVKNTVGIPGVCCTCHQTDETRQSKCTEMILELNHSIEVRMWSMLSSTISLFIHFEGNTKSQCVCEDSCGVSYQIPKECTIQPGGNQRQLNGMGVDRCMMRCEVECCDKLEVLVWHLAAVSIYTRPLVPLNHHQYLIRVLSI